MPLWKLASLVPQRDYAPLAQVAASDELRQVAAAYVENMRRVDAIAWMPAVVAENVETVVRCELQAVFEMTKSLDPLDAGSDDAKRTVKRELELFHDIRKRAVETRANDPASSVDRFTYVEVILHHESEFLPFIHPWVCSLLTGTWTAFETMAGDLWEACANARPDQLHHDETTEGKQSKAAASAVDIKTLRGYGFNLRGVLGTLLRRAMKFDSLDNIRDAYPTLFGRGADSVLRAVRDKSLDKLAHLRHAIVHRGGKCDDKYLAIASGELGLPVGAEGESIPLDGPFVGGLIDSVFKCGSALIVAADKWVDTIPEKTT